MSESCRKRHVFYLPGFDPRGVRHYHSLYKTHAILQNKVNGLGLDVGARQRASDHSFIWPVRAGDTQTDIEFLAWDDIIRREWGGNMLSGARDFLQSLHLGLLQGVLPRLVKSCPHALYGGVYPLVYVFIFLILSGTALLASVSVIGGFFGIVAGTLLAAAVLWGGDWLGRKIGVFWLLGIFSFSARWGRGRIAGLGERIKFFSRRMESVLQQNDVDEIVVVGHSVGAMLAVPMIARLLRRTTPDKPVTLMTLGQCIPLLSMQREQQAYRDDMMLLSMHDKLLWVDYSAPTDGACFAQKNPLAVSGIALPAGAGPKILSPRFFKLYNKENYARLKYRWYTMHFLYLMSSDLPGEYDYFAMTAGSTPFASRFAKNVVEA